MIMKPSPILVGVFPESCRGRGMDVVVVRNVSTVTIINIIIAADSGRQQ